MSTDHTVSYDPDLVTALDSNPDPAFNRDSSLDLDPCSVYDAFQIINGTGKGGAGAAGRGGQQTPKASPGGD
ncbi:hypothetical protein EVAR_27898_1 [Eumeta japonica]|uniref:Uncharacterized protein n=1 Tax=Eumeta variegata TaxID=151549 RepID=A0A4C1UW94_EUMVA|nr:hypothetical protein EVAR_27898_1 [Eumeta japonica]